MKNKVKVITLSCATALLLSPIISGATEAKADQTSESDAYQTSQVSNANSSVTSQEDSIVNGETKIVPDNYSENSNFPFITFAGGTYVKGSTLYLNSAICKAIIWGGAGAAAYYVIPLLGVVGIGGGAAGTASFSVGTAILDLGSKATTRGAWVRLGGSRVVSFGYQ